jgi:hypothetical protein
VFDTVTGEKAVWDIGQKKWVPWMPDSTPVDWDDVRMRREAWEKRQAERLARYEAFLKKIPKMSLEEQVAWADSIEVFVYDDKYRRVSIPTVTTIGNARFYQPYGLFRPQQASLKRLKASMRGPIRDLLGGVSPSLDMKDGDIFIMFEGLMEEGALGRFFLSNAASDNKTVFPAPPTIVDDVTAEVKRQEPRQKEIDEEELQRILRGRPVEARPGLQRPPGLVLVREAEEE